MIVIKNVIKRDGCMEEFDINKILIAVQKAYKSCKEKYTKEIEAQLIGYLETSFNQLSEPYTKCNESEINIEHIQNILEDFLMSVNKNVAKAFILYRSEHSSMRDAESMSQFIDEYIGASNAATGSKFDPNANIEQKNICTLQGELSKKKFIDLNRYRLTQAIKKRYSKSLSKQYIEDLNNHLIYKHDETSISSYCLSMSMYPFLKNGMKSLGGPSTAPTNLESFCGQFCNMIFAVSSQVAGACLYKDQELILGTKDNIYPQKIKDFVDTFELNKSFENYQGNWEYADISNNDIYVAEDGKAVKVKKVYRRKYNDDIYKITTKNGCEVLVSKDHIFKTRFRGRDIEVKAKDLIEYDTIYTNKDYSYLVNKTSNDYMDGQFLGIVCGDGSITDKYQFRVAINTEQMFIYDFIDKYIKENYGLSGHFVLDERKNAKCGTYQLSNKELVADIQSKMISCDKYNTFNKNIDISKRSLSFQLGFLDGLLVTDGSFALNKGFTIALVNKGLIETVNRILNNLNIYKKITTIPANIEKHKSEYYQINIPLRVIKYLNLAHQKPTNSSKLDVDLRSFVHDINFYGREKYQISFLGQQYRTESINKNYGNIISISETNLPHLKDLHTTVVTNIEKIKNDDEYVYEIETETHWYNCGGLITHNCATPEFLMYLDYFIRKEFGNEYIDNLHKIVRYEGKNRSIKDVIEAKFQQVVHTLNQPAAARNFQCVKENTKLWTPNGFKSLNELKEGDECYVWNNGIYKIEKINKLNIYNYDSNIDGNLIKFTGRNYQQTVTPNHRVVYKIPNTQDYKIKYAKDLVGHSKMSCPISGKINIKDYNISDSLLKLITYTLTDGSIIFNKERNTYNLYYYMSPNRRGFSDLISVLDDNKLVYSIKKATKSLFGKVNIIKINNDDSKFILNYINNTKQEIPLFFNYLSERQCKLLLTCWSNTDGYSAKGRQHFQCDNMQIAETLQTIVMRAGYGSQIIKRMCNCLNLNEKTETIYVETFIRNDKRVKNFIEEEYKGIVWCPSTDTGVVIFKEENNIPYISGNSVFWNIGYFDSFYFKSMFETFRFPDNSAPKWETLSWLQKDFMQWFNNERLKTPLTFPVETMALLTDGNNDYMDKEYADFTAKMYSEGHSFFTYISDSADSLSSCCFEGNEVIQVTTNNKNKYYITIKDFVENNTFQINKYGEKLINSKNYIDSYNILTNKIEKTLITGVLKKEYSGKMYKFNVNNNIINVTADHLILVKNKLTNKIEEVSAEIIYKNKDNYLIAIK